MLRLRLRPDADAAEADADAEGVADAELDTNTRTGRELGCRWGRDLAFVDCVGRLGGKTSNL